MRWSALQFSSVLLIGTRKSFSPTDSRIGVLKFAALRIGFWSSHGWRLFPRRPAHHQLAMVDAVARAPLRLDVGLAGVADDALVTRRRGLEPVREVAAVAGAGRDLARRVDERKPLDRLVRRFVDVVGGTRERIELNRARERLAESGRAR